MHFKVKSTYKIFAALKHDLESLLQYKYLHSEVYYAARRQKSLLQSTFHNKIKKQSARQPTLANYILIPSCELWFSSTQQVRDEICFTAHMYVALVGTATQALVQRSAVALFLAAVQLANKNIVCPKDFIFAVSAKPVLKQNIAELNSYSSRNLDQLSLSSNTLSHLLAHAIFKLGYVRFMVLQKVKQ